MEKCIHKVCDDDDLCLEIDALNKNVDHNDYDNDLKWRWVNECIDFSVVDKVKTKNR